MYDSLTGKPISFTNQRQGQQRSAYLQADLPDLANFCDRWLIIELAVFGSILRSDFSETSDIDFLVSFGSETQCGRLD
ncbi:nucleotidyltransferase domain-containing protein [Almyronema epifaneia]|uniref:Nucleotidyltransferase domain-containing protein n=1 Tax=Almyronema epifaneia S1 TaxID=2991925 RepID=A0ABW6IHZ8_9CYAN